jgi:hypothetical protein
MEEEIEVFQFPPDEEFKGPVETEKEEDDLKKEKEVESDATESEEEYDEPQLD